jgi:DNA-binding LacI/PurR family transcriptional regulator
MNQTLIKTEPLYIQLKNKLEKLIEAENLAMLPRERDLEKLFGISRITVRKAVKELTKEGKVIPVQGRGTMVAKNAPLQSREIGVIAGSYTWHTENLFAVASEETKKLNYNLSTFVLDIEDKNMALPSSNTLFSHLIASDRLNGLLLSVKIREESLKHLIKKKIPIVISGFKYKKYNAPSVRYEFHKPIEEMTKKLLETGISKIAFIATMNETEEQDNAIGDFHLFHKSYYDIIKKFRLPEYYFQKRGIESAKDALEKLYALPQKERPQAIVARYFRDRKPAIDFLNEKKDWKPLFISGGPLSENYPRISAEPGIVVRKSIQLLSQMIENPEKKFEDILIPVKIILPDQYLKKRKLIRKTKEL